MLARLLYAYNITKKQKLKEGLINMIYSLTEIEARYQETDKMGLFIMGTMLHGLRLLEQTT